MTDEEKHNKVIQIFGENSFAENIEFISECGELGDVACAYKAGEMYFEGKQVPKNTEKAKKLFKIGADHEHLLCCHYMALILLDDPSTADEGIEYLSKAAFLGNEASFILLAEFRKNNIPLYNKFDTIFSEKYMNKISEDSDNDVPSANYILGLISYYFGDDSDEKNTGLYMIKCASDEGYMLARSTYSRLSAQGISPDLQKISQTVNQSDSDKQHTKTSKGCYIATCVYGSYDCPQVWTLRRYRDNILAKSWYGRLFIKIYYALSPSVVKIFGETEWFKRIWKRRLDKKLIKLRARGIESTKYEDKNR